MICDPVLAWEPVPPGATIKCELDMTQFLANWHRQGQLYQDNAVVRVPGVPGYEYTATVGGQTGTKQIRFPQTLADTVTDGSVTWTCQQLSTNSLKATVDGVPTWTVPSGYAVDDEAVAYNVASALVDVPASADGDDAEITITVTLSDTQVWPITVVLPVRKPTRRC